MKLGMIFPGQGSQTIGMGKEFYDRYDSVKELFKEADEATGAPITSLCFEGPEDELRKTENTQPAILTVSVACQKILAEHGVLPEMVAGHSLGEYSALVAAGVLSFADAVAVVKKRGRFMQEAVPLGRGAMAAVLGLSREAIVEICLDSSSDQAPVQAVNFNCPGQVVIAGSTEAVQIAEGKLKEAGAKRVIGLPVSAPFHSILMQPAALRLQTELDEIDFNDAKIPVVVNVDGSVVTKGSELRNLLVRQAASPVFWEDCMLTMAKEGITLFVEAGPGKVLTGFTKKILKDAESLNVEDLASLEKSLDYLKGVR
ncbi:MAG: ACP S-malonyltransferase [Negativicutes bacterium]|nr:ACP S-malonyltransferase [Negativicutes bacterium]